MRLKGLVAALALTLAAAASADAEELRFGFQGDADSMDPYTLNETFTLGFQGNIYEGLIRRGAGPRDRAGAGRTLGGGRAEPLALPPAPRRALPRRRGLHRRRRGVLGQPGAGRRLGPQDPHSPATPTCVKVDDHTVDFVTSKPQPHPARGVGHPGTSSTKELGREARRGDARSHGRRRGEAHHAPRQRHGPLPPGQPRGRRQDRGRGQSRLVGRGQPAAQPDPGDVHGPIASDATRVAALLSGQVDMAYPIPVQDMQRIDGDADTRMLVGPELRTIFLGMDQVPRRAALFRRQGQEPVQGQAGPRGLLPRHRHRGDPARR